MDFQVHGRLHHYIATCLRNLSKISFNTGRIEAALIQQTEAVVSLERTLGLDHGDTILGVVCMWVYVCVCVCVCVYVCSTANMKNITMF